MSEWREDPFGRYAERLFVSDGPTEVVRIGDIEVRDPLGAQPDVAPRIPATDVEAAPPRIQERRGGWSAAVVVFVVAVAVGLGVFLSGRHSGHADAPAKTAPASSQAPPTSDAWASGPGPAAVSKIGTDFTGISNDDAVGKIEDAEALCAASLADLDALNSTLPVADSTLNADLENVISYAHTSLLDCQNGDLNDEQTNSNEATHYIRAAEPFIRGDH